MEQELQVQVCSLFFNTNSCPQQFETVEVGFKTDQILRSDIDVVAIRANCAFIGYEGSNYNGAQMTVHQKPYDRFPLLLFTHFQPNL